MASSFTSKDVRCLLRREVKTSGVNDMTPSRGAYSPSAGVGGGGEKKYSCKQSLYKIIIKSNDVMPKQKANTLESGK